MGNILLKNVDETTHIRLKLEAIKLGKKLPEHIINLLRNSSLKEDVYKNKNGGLQHES